MKTDAIELVGIVGVALLMVVGLSVIMAIPTYYLWNWIIPDVSQGGVTSITFFQAIGLNILSSILFKPTTGGKNE